MISKAKFVLNGAIDMAGEDRGNMRCFEALGCGALMISDHGHYPTGFVYGIMMLPYSSAEEAASLTINTLKNWGRAGEIAKNGRGMVTSRCSKTAQWERFWLSWNEEVFAQWAYSSLRHPYKKSCARIV